MTDAGPEGIDAMGMGGNADSSTRGKTMCRIPQAHSPLLHPVLGLGSMTKASVLAAPSMSSGHAASKNQPLG